MDKALRRTITDRDLHCVECGVEWTVPMEMWRAYLSDEEPPQTVFYCPDCASREFG